MGLMEVLSDLTQQSDGNFSGVPMDDSFYKKHWGISVFYITVMAVTMLVGVIGNFMIIAAVFMYQKLQTKANVFIVSLAIADTFVVCSVQGFNVMGLTLGCRFFAAHPGLCHMLASLCIISCSASLWTMAVIAINRYFCICHQNLYAVMFNTYTKCILIALMVWIICWAIQLPTSYDIWSSYTFDRKLKTCFYDRKVYSYTVFMMFFTLNPALAVVFICYMMVFLHVQSTQLDVQQVEAKTEHTGGIGGKWLKSEMELAKTLFLIFIVFCFCWLPYSFLAIFDYNDQWPMVVYMVVFQLAHVSSSLNCIIYVAYNKDFRDGCIHVFRKGNLTSNGENSYTVTGAKGKDFREWWDAKKNRNDSIENVLAIPESVNSSKE